MNNELIPTIIGIILGTLITITLITYPASPSEILTIRHLNEQEIENQIHQLVNQERTTNNIKPLTRNPTIDQIAKKHSLTMHETGVFEHANQTFYGENIVQVPVFPNVQGCDKPTWNNEEMANCMFTLWKHSRGHYDNIIHYGYTETGIGVKCHLFTCHATQNFKDKDTI